MGELSSNRVQAEADTKMRLLVLIPLPKKQVFSESIFHGVKTP